MNLRKIAKGSSGMAIVTVLVLIALCSSAHGLKTKAGVEKKSRSASNNLEVEKVGVVKESVDTKSNSTLASFLHLEKWIAPRLIDQLTSSFNTVGLPGTALAGIALLVLLPIYLGAVAVGWVPLHKLLHSSNDEPDYSGYYKAPAPAPMPFYGEPSKPPMYGYPAAPSPSPQYGYGYGEAPAAKSNYGWAEASAPKPHYGYPESPAPSTNYGYSPSPSPAPAPAPSPMYGYAAGNAPVPAPSPSYGYSPSIPTDPPSISYGYTAILPSPAPSQQYGEPSKPSVSYGVVDDDNSNSHTLKSDIKISARKSRSIRRLSDDQCVERIACELSQATKRVRLPNWVKSMAEMFPMKDNSIVNEARKLMSVSTNCARFRCDSYDVWGQY